MHHKTVLCLAGLCASLLAGNALAADMPARFRGQWAESQQACNPKSLAANNQVKITATQLDAYEMSCRLKKLKPGSDEQQLAAVFACNVEGEVSDMSYRMVLQEEGRGLQLNGKNLIRCK